MPPAALGGPRQPQGGNKPFAAAAAAACAVDDGHASLVAFSAAPLALGLATDFGASQ